MLPSLSLQHFTFGLFLNFKHALEMDSFGIWVCEIVWACTYASCILWETLFVFTWGKNPGDLPLSYCDERLLNFLQLGQELCSSFWCIQNENDRLENNKVFFRIKRRNTLILLQLKSFSVNRCLLCKKKQNVTSRL